MKSYRHCSEESLSWTELDEKEIICLNLNTGNYSGMKGIARDIWDKLKDTKPEEQLVSEIIKIYDVDGERAKRDVHFFLNDLLKAGLIEEV